MKLKRLETGETFVHNGKTHTVTGKTYDWKENLDDLNHTNKLRAIEQYLKVRLKNVRRKRI